MFAAEVDICDVVSKVALAEEPLLAVVALELALSLALVPLVTQQRPFVGVLAPALAPERGLRLLRH